MKKAMIIVVLTGMFAWAVYDFVIDSQEDQSAQTPEQNDFTVEESSAQDSEKSEGSTNEPGEHTGEDTVGIEEGNLAPDFQLETMEGEHVKLSDLRGQRVMVNFWATWCPPCRAEIPDMQRFYEDKDVEILAINLTDTESRRSDVEDFAEAYGMTFPILMDENTEVADEYQIQPIPTSFMIDADGRIQFRAFGPMNYELMVQAFEQME